jgi:hypothetical protein
MLRSKMVEFQGKRYWLLEMGDGSGALAYLEHCDENGEVTFDHAMDTSFAHLYPDGHISRYGVRIGAKEDLVFLDSKGEQKVNTEDKDKTIEVLTAVRDTLGETLVSTNNAEACPTFTGLPNSALPMLMEWAFAHGKKIGQAGALTEVEGIDHIVADEARNVLKQKATSATNTASN